MSLGSLVENQGPAAPTKKPLAKVLTLSPKIAMISPFLSCNVFARGQMVERDDVVKGSFARLIIFLCQLDDNTRFAQFDSHQHNI